MVLKLDGSKKKKKVRNYTEQKQPQSLANNRFSPILKISTQCYFEPSNVSGSSPLTDHRNKIAIQIQKYLIYSSASTLQWFLTSLGCWWRLRILVCQPQWGGASLLAPRFLQWMPRSELSFLFFLWGRKIKHRFLKLLHKKWIICVFRRCKCACVFYLLLREWLSQGTGQWGRGCWSRWIFQVQIHL